MPNASYLQTSFLGGMWSTTAQGRADEEAYRTALNVSFNALPIEAGAHTRRSGTVAPQTTRSGKPGVLREFGFSQNAPYNMEFTDGHLRLWAGTSLVLIYPHGVGAVVAANPAQLVIPAGFSGEWATGDQIEVAATPIGSPSPLGIAPLLNRVFSITVVDAAHVSLQDPITGANIDGTALNMTGWNLSAAKVLDFVTPYVFGTAWSTTQIRVVQDEEVAFVLCPGFQPYALTNSGPDNSPVFAWTIPTFLDGPYLDPPVDGSTLTPSGTSGSITLTASSVASINNGLGFQSTDVGRMVRLFAQPLLWSASTTYSVGQQVLFQTGAGPAYYSSIVNGNKGIEPDTDPGTHWAISTTAAAWTWALITAVTDTLHVTATLQAASIDIFQQPLAGGNLLNTNAVTVWRLGSWSNTTGWPTCGGFQSARFWFGGPTKNAFAATMSNQDYNFCPTLLDGTVADNNGFSETIKTKQRNTIFWMEPVAEGMALGTQGGEWLVQASAQNEPITATSIKADPVSQYGCANVEPRNVGIAMAFVQRYQKQVYEYLADVYSRKFSGTNLARRARNLTAPGVVELAYTKENAPVLWARTALNQLIGCTYKRSSPFATQTPADFYGWHYHTLGSGRSVESIAAGPSQDGTIDTLAMVTYDAVANVRWVEFMQPVFEETDLITQGWFVDSGVSPAAAEVLTVNGHLSVVYYGLMNLAGKTLTVVIGGIDAGDYVVSATGTITVPIDGTANPLLTQATLVALTAQGGFGLLGVSIRVSAAGSGFTSPVGAALNYTSSSTAGSHYSQGTFDWDSGKLYHQQAQQGGDPGTNGHSLFVFNIATRAQIAGPLDPGELAQASPTCVCMGYDGNIYYATIDGTHLVGRYKVSSGANDITYSNVSLDAPGYIVPIHTGGSEYVCYTSLNSGLTGARINMIQMTGAVTEAGVPFTVDEAPGSLGPGNAFPCRGPTGSAFVIALGLIGGIGNNQVGVYRATADPLGFGGVLKIGVVTPAQIHSSWTNFAVGVPLYDETDGNIIAIFNNGGVVVMAKINTISAAVMWTLTLLVSTDISTSRIRGGVLNYVDGTGSPYSLKTINTLTGAVTTTQAETVIPPNTQSTDDKTGQVVVKVNDIGTQMWATFGPTVGGGAITPALYYSAPAAFGFNYISQGQILRPIGPQETGSQSGPAQGQTRRSHMYSALLSNTQGIQVGTNFTKMRAAKLVTAGRTVALAANVLFTDVIQDTLEDTASFHSMWAWQTVRPCPTTVVSVECWIKTEGR